MRVTNDDIFKTSDRRNCYLNGLSCSNMSCAKCNIPIIFLMEGGNELMEDRIRNA